MSKEINVSLILDADSKDLVIETDKVKVSLNEISRAAIDAASKTQSGLDKTSTGIKSIGDQLKIAKAELFNFFTLSSTFFDLTKDFINIADNYSLLNTKLLAITGSQQTFNTAQATAAEIARGSRSDYGSTVDLYAKLSTAAAQYNIEQEKISSTVEATAYGLKLFGASTAEVTSTQTQFIQALSSGVLAGDAFKSMVETSPRLMQALADGIGIARSELNQMAVDGKLTTQVVVDALSTQSNVLKEEFSAMPVTVSEAWGQVKNAVGLSIADFNTTNGITAELAGTLLFVADNIDLVTESIKTLLTVGLAALIGRLSSFSIASVVDKFKEIRLAAAATTTGFATLTIVSNALKAALALVGGPIGAAITAVVALGTAVYTAYQKTDTFNTSLNKIIKIVEINKNSIPELRARVSGLADDMSQGASVALRSARAIAKDTKAKIENTKASLNAAIAKKNLDLESLKNVYQFGNAGAEVEARYKATQKSISDLQKQLREFKKIEAEATAQIANIETTGVGVIEKNIYTFKEFSTTVREGVDSIKNLNYQLKTEQISPEQYAESIQKTSATIQKVPGALDAVLKALEKTKKGTDSAGGGLRTLSGSLDNVTASATKFHESFSAKISNDFNNIVESLLTDAEKIDKEFRDKQLTLATMLELGNIDYKTYEKYNDQLIEINEEANRKLQDKNTKTTNLITEQFKSAVNEINGAFSNLWGSFLETGTLSFDGLIDTAKNSFTKIFQSVTTQAFKGLFNLDGKGEGDNKTQAGIWETLNDGFTSLDKNFESFFNKIGLSGSVGEYAGQAATGGLLGITVGGATASAMGDNSITTQLVSGLAGAAAKVGASAAISAMGGLGMSTAMAGLAATGVGAIAAVAVAALMAASGHQKTSESMYYGTFGGTTLDSKSRDIDQSQSEDFINAMFDTVSLKLAKYSIELDEDVRGYTTIKDNDKGYRQYFGVDGPGRELGYYTELWGDDAKDPEKVAQAMMQMQVAALAYADWSDYSNAIQNAMELAVPADMDVDQINSLYDYIDTVKLLSNIVSTEALGISDTIDTFGGSLTELQTFVQSTYQIYDELGQAGVDALNDYTSQLEDDSNIADITESFSVVSQAIGAFNQDMGDDAKAIVAISQDITGALGGTAAAAATINELFSNIAPDIEIAGTNYENAIKQVELYNSALGLSGDQMITTKEQLWEYVQALDPLSNDYANQIQTVTDLSNALVTAGDASGYFTSAIDSITDSISDTVTNIREDLMSDEELYNSRKEQAESLVASIATMTDVNEIESVTDQVNNIVNSMWNSLDESQQTSGVGDWMIDFLDDLETLSTGRVEEIQNQYGGNNELGSDYGELSSIATGNANSEASEISGMMNSLIELLDKPQQDTVDINDWIVNFMESNNVLSEDQTQDQYDNKLGSCEGTPNVTAESMTEVMNQLSVLATQNMQSNETQNQAMQTLDRGSNTILSASNSLSQAASAMDSVVGKMNRALSNINIDVDVHQYTHSTEVG